MMAETMAGMDRLLTAREASFVAGVSYDKVVKALENRTVPNRAGRARQRALDLDGVLSLTLSDRLQGYPALMRRRVSRRVLEHLRGDGPDANAPDIIDSDGLVVTTFRTGELFRGVQERLSILVKLTASVERNPDVQGGAPVFRGTRIMVHHIADLLRSGTNRREIQEDFPDLDEEMLELALLFDRLHPVKGRPVRKAGQSEISLPD
ncbi:DUF433 domain-containing protein [Niveispirillum sp. KHB5.9]|uniref:DUF433 domain-containing protein n=1 Tax=Niveispirillum sp. KHB5.9 TaxID=3400269 RepID=UPI003A89B04D